MSKKSLHNLFVSSLGLGALFFIGILVSTAGIPSTTNAESVPHPPPVISSISSSPSDTTAIITWTTSVPADSQVVFGVSTLNSVFSELRTAPVTNHSVVITDLKPNTQYHFQVLSQNAASPDASSGLGISDDGVFTTQAAHTTSAPESDGVHTNDSSSGAPPIANFNLPVISQLLSTTTDISATVTWNTDQPATGQIFFGTSSSYTNTSSFTNAFQKDHSIVVNNLLPNTEYHFNVYSGTQVGVASSSDYVFKTQTPISNPVVSTEPPPPVAPPNAEIASLRQEIEGMKHRMNLFERILAWILGYPVDNFDANHSATPPATPATGLPPVSTPSPTPPATPAPEATPNTATIGQNGATYAPGASVDFSGKNFGHEESVIITKGGASVRQVHADGGGNFSSGSITLPTDAGAYQYVFTGEQSHISATASITVK